MRRILVVAYHFPPQSGSSGLLRSLKFARYLLEHRWLPTVLTVNPRAYERLDDRQVSEVPAAVSVVRAFALDTRRHLSVRGRYLRWMTLPDRWASWCLGGTPAGLWITQKQRVDVIFSTFPVATAILIGLILHRCTGRPWVVDFRDSMTEEHYPRDPLTWRVWRWLESQAIRYGSRFLFTADATRSMYLKRYPHLRPQDCLVISNGYDEDDFAGLEGLHRELKHGPIRLVHAGLVYPEERNPRPLFRALARLKAEGRIDASQLIVELRAPGSEDYYTAILAELNLADVVHLLPSLPYRQALEDCAAASALLLLQAACCDHQIPAKAYEYLRLQRPILALVSSTGETAALLRQTRGATLLDIGDEQELYRELPGFLAAVRNQQHPVAKLDVVQQFSRRGQASVLAQCLDQLMEEAARADTEEGLTTGSAVSTDQPARSLAENQSKRQGGI